MRNMEQTFKASWARCINSSEKLSFYTTIKSDFGWENYLDHASNFNIRRSTAQLRCSSHKLRIETGRHSKINRADRLCVYCFSELSSSQVDDENHLLSSCPIGDKERQIFDRNFTDITGSPRDPNFNLAKASVERSFNNSPFTPSDLDIQLIKTSTKSLHVIYQRKLKYMELHKKKKKIKDMTKLVESA